MKLASKQLLALGLRPTEVIDLQDHAQEEGIELRVLAQKILRDWLHDHRKANLTGEGGVTT